MIRSFKEKIKRVLWPFIRPYKIILPQTMPTFIWYCMRLHLPKFLAILACGLFWSFYISALPYTVKNIIDTVAKYGDNGDDLIKFIKIPALTFFSLYFCVVLSFRLRDYLFLKTIPEIQRMVWMRKSSYLKRHSHSYFQRHMTGNLANKISDLTRGTSIIFEMSESFIIQFVAIIFAIFTMYQAHIYFSMILIGWSLVFLTMTILFSRGSYKYSKAFSESRSILSGKLVDIIQNIFSARIFVRTKFEEQYMARYAKDTKKKDQALQLYMVKVRIIQGLVTSTLVGLMLITLIHAKKNNLITIGDFALVLNLTMVISGMVWTLGVNLTHFSRELGICSKALSTLNKPHEVIDKENAKELLVKKGQISFNKVCFEYDEKLKVFKDLDISINAGEKVGLVGFSGGGKTTFVNLILRLFDLNKGSIKIDGQNISDVTIGSLRKNISYIPQEPSLFNRSVMDNIRYGRLKSSDEEVIRAAKAAKCHEFIMRLDSGYETIVGERGVKLSGGQRQRIAIARAILRDGPILIMDEATSALDSVTEQYIQDVMKKITKNRTTLIIAHRLSTLKSMDRILAFKNGKIIEDGKPNSLIRKKDGYFANLWKKQADGFLPQEKAKIL